MAHIPGHPIRVAILISGRGSNLQSLVHAVRAEALAVEVCAVLSNRADAAGIVWARAQGLPAEVIAHRDFPDRDAFDAALLARLEALAPDYILLAGFMRVLGAGLVRRFAARIINIHPSLLPAFPGLHTHARALAQGVQWHGCTVHFVTAELDHGPIIAQGALAVQAHDTPETLAQRLLPLEHRLYVQVLRWLAAGRVHLGEDGRVQVDGEAHRAWLPAGPFDVAPRDAAPFIDQDSHEHP